MFIMEILSVFLLTVTLTAAQYRPPRNPRFRNPGFRNVQTPLATSATRDRPFISIPIVLLPDGQPVPKPKHSTYHYVGHATQNTPRGNSQRNNNKARGPLIGKPAANYPVAIPPPMPQQKKTAKPPKLTAAQLSSHLRNSQTNFQKQRGNVQNSQQNQNQQQKRPQQTFEQAQQMHQIQYMNQQRNPTFQHQGSQQPQPSATVHKQNIANFVNFATNLGAALASQQQNPPLILPTQTPVIGGTFQNQPSHKIQESFMNQKSLLSNHKLNNGVVIQHQVPTLQNAQLNYAQVFTSNLANHNNNGYASHQQQFSQQPQSSSQSQQQQEQTHKQSQPTAASGNQYLPASSIQSNSQSAQGSDVQNNVQYSTNQANVFQQNGGNNLRSQSGQNSLVLLNNFNSQIQQNNPQNYATSVAPQQPTPAPQVVATYDTDSLSKSILSVQQQQPSGTGYSVSSQNPQTSYTNQNQANHQNYNLNTQNQQVTFPNNGQSSSISYPSAQLSQSGGFSQQNAQTNVGQISDPLTYFHYQTTQDIPINYASFFNQGQTAYLSTQNVQQNDQTPAEQSYTVLPNSQNVFSGSSIPTIYVSQQQEASSSSDSPSESGVQTFDTYSNDQSSFSSSTNQVNQASFIAPQNLEKGYSFLQNSADSQASPSSESQLSQSSSLSGGTPLIYASSSPKQISYAQSQTSYSSTPQQYGSSSYQSASPTYVSFSSTNFKPDSQPPVNFGQKGNPGIITPGTTYAKSNQNNVKQEETAEASENNEDSEYEEEDDTDEEEASYKVVYIPLDILKNILSNSVENQ